MRELPDPVIARLRTHGFVRQAAGVDVAQSAESVLITVPHATERARVGEVSPRRFGGVRIAGSGQVSAWTVLPQGGGMGAVIDPDDLVETFIELLRVLGVLGVLGEGEHAISAGIGGSMTLVGRGGAGLGQRQTSYAFGGQQPVRIVPDEAVTAAAFDRGAPEIGRGIAQDVVDRLGV